MSDLIEQLRALRGLAHKRLVESADYKVLVELDQMLARLDPDDEAMTPQFEASPETAAEDDEAGGEDEGAEDPEAASPPPEERPPPEPEGPEDAGREPAREEILLAADTSDDAAARADGSDQGDDTPDATVSEAEGEDASADMVTLPDEGLSGEVETAAAADATEPDGSAGDDDAAADEEAAFAEALADDLRFDVSTPDSAPAPQDAQAGDDDAQTGPAGTSEDAAATAVAAALLSGEAPPAAAPSPVALAPEEDFDAAEPVAGETSDEAYESALNRLNSLIERASSRLKGEDETGSNGATVA